VSLEARRGNGRQASIGSAVPKVERTGSVGRMPRWPWRCCVALLCALVVVACGGGESNDPGKGIAGVQIERAPGRSHRQGEIEYPGKKPPSGGDHNPIPLTCGYYNAQPPDEFAVHSLEHGAVWVAYAPDTSAADVAVLKQLAEHPKVIVSPYEGLDSPVVLVAWERRLEVPSVNDPRVQQFIDAYAGGKQAPEPNQACEGVGQPAS
jgi:hypothetical protein